MRLFQFCAEVKFATLDGNPAIVGKGSNTQKCGKNKELVGPEGFF